MYFFFSSRRRHTRSCLVSWARRCVQETGINAEYMGSTNQSVYWCVGSLVQQVPGLSIKFPLLARGLAVCGDILNLPALGHDGVAGAFSNLPITIPTILGAEPSLDLVFELRVPHGFQKIYKQTGCRFRGNNQLIVARRIYGCNCFLRNLIWYEFILPSS
eukprot:TRINITY_DN7000_c0_g1_i4.p1 TRINITY_DN7000_c0_g1~~TRINITY_DN7000_c0_g1_i4.p1  ORF type:complete len:160 (+),score=29.94 TRINITY_DN7000_c0_g1_i4:2-481(+)